MRGVRRGGGQTPCACAHWCGARRERGAVRAQIMPRTLQYAAKCMASVATMDPASEQTRILRNVFRCSSKGKHDTSPGAPWWHQTQALLLD